MLNIVGSEFVTSAVKPDQYPEVPYFEIAVAGRSNVGKSSLINLLLNRKKIAKTSSTPGKTRLVNFFRVRVIRYNDDKERIGEGFFSFVDLPGYGYARVSKSERESWKVMIRKYLESRPQLRLLMLLVDIRHGIDPKDLVMVEMLQSYKILFMIIATKSDKIPKNEIPKYIKNMSKEMLIDPKQIVAVSSLKRTGLDKLMERLEEILF